MEGEVNFYPSEFSYISCYNKKKDEKRNEKRLNRKKRKTSRRLKTRQYIYDYLQTHPCVKCQEKDPILLTFDHLDPSIKVDTISNLMRESFTKLIIEIEKCRVLCVSCHTKHTAEQQGWYDDLKK